MLEIEQVLKLWYRSYCFKIYDENINK